MSTSTLFAPCLYRTRLKTRLSSLRSGGVHRSVTPMPSTLSLLLNCHRLYADAVPRRPPCCESWSMPHRHNWPECDKMGHKLQKNCRTAGHPLPHSLCSFTVIPTLLAGILPCQPAVSVCIRNEGRECVLIAEVYHDAFWQRTWCGNLFVCQETFIPNFYPIR